VLGPILSTMHGARTDWAVMNQPQNLQRVIHATAQYGHPTHQTSIRDLHGSISHQTRTVHESSGTPITIQARTIAGDKFLNEKITRTLPLTTIPNSDRGHPSYAQNHVHPIKNLGLASGQIIRNQSSNTVHTEPRNNSQQFSQPKSIQNQTGGMVMQMTSPNPFVKVTRCITKAS
jgi:hypothetical protein